MNDEEKVWDGNNSTTMQVLGAEIQDHARIAKEYKQKIDEAKTEPKRKYYEKKLAKNNKKAFQILLALEELSRVKNIEAAALEEKEQDDEGPE